VLVEHRNDVHSVTHRQKIDRVRKSSHQDPTQTSILEFVRVRPFCGSLECGVELKNEFGTEAWTLLFVPLSRRRGVIDCSRLDP
jgi:hypothetical protein